MSDNPLAKLGDLSKPATTLIEKISEAVGGIFKPYQIVRIAKAEAQAERIRAESQIQVTDLHRRALHRFLEEEAKRQSNIEAITQKAIPLLGEQSAPENVQDDWITNFFEKSRIVSDEDMQHLWARILAGEANAPGSFSKRTVNLMSDLEKSDAELFINLCGFGWKIGYIVPLIYDYRDEIYNRHGIHFDSLSHLESLGLIQFRTSGFKRLGLPKVTQVFYYGQPLTLTLPKDEDNELDIGTVVLTRAGHELARICGARPVDGFFDYVKQRWKSFLPKEEPEQGAQTDDTANGGPVA
ncbi:MAG: DUF2806 domain-containing protein [Gammaproteobacteria bacterium]|nr:MAG: DUF2806 domain-containing protein [Gammaproteobacteria bacterium]